jgi:hypothetical protein
LAWRWPVVLWAAITLTFVLGAACADVTNPRIPRSDDTVGIDSNLIGFLMPSLPHGGTLVG